MSYLPQLNISDFDYNLPKDRIAIYPTDKRNFSKLLFYDINSRQIIHKYFNDVIDLIPINSLVLRNSTKVISARILMQKPSGGKCELLLIEPLLPYQDPALVMTTKNHCQWNCIIGGKNVNVGLKLKCITSNKYNFTATVVDRESNYGKIEFNWDGDSSFAEVIKEVGKIPLPPYIDRDTETIDHDRYQTVYANIDGSIAAPTAGLHFTNEIFDLMKIKGIKLSDIILHVGPGTFLPVSNDDIREHNMHEELAIITKSTILAIKYNIENFQNIVAVGTTSVRTIETLYWLGQQLSIDKNYDLNNFLFEQETPYFISSKYDLISPLESIQRIIDYLEINNLEYLSGKTKLFIVPGYKFKFVNGIITNFHLPKSTLLLLISAFIGGNDWINIYQNALENDYRFLSYGDSSFLFNNI
jgi:S-adenosylmethionine:tRNA ribosyltransferase-isomerase